MKEKQYKNVVEYILKDFCGLTEYEYSHERQEMQFDNEERERKIINELTDFRQYFNVIYQGYKDSCHWYKIKITDMNGLSNAYSFKM